MFLEELATPAILVDTEILSNNIHRYQKTVDEAGKALWPMTKTHKSTQIARMQIDAGATGLLCGTLDECEAFAALGVPLMYAYPPAGERSVQRVISLAKRCSLILRLDGKEAARNLDEAAGRAGITLDYTLIIDAGLHRFGVEPESVPDLLSKLEHYKNLKWRGLSTHPGQVYGASKPEEVEGYAEEERQAVERACEALRKAGKTPEILSSGSTPTHFQMCSDSRYNTLHPGNYVFCDAIQMSTDTASEADCALTILATVISHPAADRFIIDAGAKTLGLDQGAHGCASARGFGHVIGHPELNLYSLSEEVGKIHAEGETSLHVGDKIRIIPNHACSSANCTSAYMAVNGRTVTGEIAVDVRGNSKTRL